MSSAQCRAAGVSLDRAERAARAGRWVRITRGVYDTTPDAPVTFASRRRRAAWTALLAFGPEAVSVGPCALVLLGAAGLPVHVTPQVALPGARRTPSRDGVLLRQFDDGMTVVPVSGRLVASPEWALAQAVPELGRRRAVAVMDSALHLGLLDRSGLDRAHEHARGRRGVARTHGWWELADGLAGSPLETWARLDCIEAGVPPDRLQVPLVDADGVVRRADLGWQRGGGRWLVAEVDGAEVHDTPSAAFADRRRHNALVATGRVEILRFTAQDLRVPGRVGATVRAMLGLR